MKPKQWEIWLYDFEEEPHPVVILNGEERCANAGNFNGLFCQTLRGARPLKKHEGVLNSADGLDWRTACRRDYLYELEEERFVRKRGEVCSARRRVIANMIRQILRLPFD